MIRFISRASTTTYKYLAKPILFKIPPDNVHNYLLSVGGVVQKSNLICKLISSSWSYGNNQFLAQNINGLSFKNPVGLSAGLDKNIQLARLMKAVGFGFMDGGSITYRKSAGNPRPWFYRLPKSRSLVVYAGLANDGAGAIIGRLKKYPKNIFNDFVLNVSVAKTNDRKTVSEEEGVADYVGSLNLIKRNKSAQMVTLNISCPNAFGGEPFTEPAKLKRLLRAVEEVKLGIPVFIKMPSDLAWNDFKALLDVASDFDLVKGVVIANLAKDRNNLELSDPLPNSVKGNLSGKPVQRLSDEMIRQTHLTYGKRFTIIGVGGVFSAEDAYRKITLGASLVALVTGVIFEGPQLVGQINRELVKLLENDGFDNVSQAIGTKA